QRLVLEVWTDGSVAPGTAGAEESRILEEHLELLTTFSPATAGGEAGTRAAERDPRPPRRRARALRPRVELPQEREHPDHRRARAQDRGRAAQDAELRQEIAQGDDDGAWGDGPLARYEPGS